MKRNPKTTTNTRPWTLISGFLYRYPVPQPSVCHVVCFVLRSAPPGRRPSRPVSRRTLVFMTHLLVYVALLLPPISLSITSLLCHDWQVPPHHLCFSSCDSSCLNTAASPLCRSRYAFSFLCSQWSLDTFAPLFPFDPSHISYFRPFRCGPRGAREALHPEATTVLCSFRLPV